MGGRCSNFSVNTETGEHFTSKDIPIPLIEDDSISERNNDLIDILQDKNHVVCYSTDNFNYDIIEPNIKKLNQMVDKYPGVTYNLKGYNLEIRGATYKDSGTIASFCYHIEDKNNMSIFLNKDYYTDNKSEMISLQKEAKKRNWFSKSDENELLNASIAHEYGHFIEKLIIDKKINEEKSQKDMTHFDFDLAFSYHAIKIKREILKIQKEKFNSDEQFISEYGRKNSREFFAEAFSNLVTSKNPTTIAKATEIYIKENL